MRFRLLFGSALLVLACSYFFTLDSRERQAGFGAETESIAAHRNEQQRSPLAADNGETIGASPSHQDACPEKPSIDAEVHDGDWLRERTSRQANALAATNDAEHLLAAAVLSKFQGVEQTMDLLERAARLAPTNPIIASTRLRLCRESQSSECDMDRVIANALMVDGDNGAVVMEAALLRLAANRLVEAEALVRRAVGAPRFDNYFIDYAIILERAAATRGDNNYRDRMVEGIGYAAAMSVSYYKITTFCKSIEQQNTSWLALCDDLGKKMHSDGRSLLDNLIGLELRKIAANKSDIKRRIETVTAEYDAFRQYYMSNLLNRDGLGLLENDEAVLRRYVDAFSTYGEMAALEVLNAEVTRLKVLPGYNQCNFIPTHWQNLLQ